MNTSTKIGEIVAIVPSAVSVFEQFRIDCYRSAAQPLNDLCLAQGLSSEHVLCSVEEEAEAASSTDSTQKDWRHEPLSALIEHIIQRHHQFTREVFLKLQPVIDALLERHRRTHAQVGKLRMDLQLVERELTLHLRKEEEMVFPHIRLLENGSAAEPSASLFFRSVRRPVNTLMSVMSDEHELTDGLLAGIHEIANAMNIHDPEFGQLQQLLRALKRDLLVHSCLEDYVLFPRARKLEMGHPDCLLPGSPLL